MNKVTRIKAGSFNDAAEAKLASSGLTPEQANQCGMYSVNNAMQMDDQFQMQPALVIPYMDTRGKPLKPHKSWPDFYRLRYLGEGEVKTISFAEAAGKKASRYTQPANTGVCAYFPQLVDWDAISKDTNEPVLITEGELKATKATAEGFPTIGLGGVYNFRASNVGLFFLPELEAFTWARRRVTIVYDSDFASNSMICHAINALAEELQERGALVYVAFLENVYEDEDAKTGLDDFLVERDDKALIEILKAAEPLGISRRLWQMNNEVVYVRDPGMVVAQKSGQKMDCSKFAAHSDWATISVAERKMKPDGTMAVGKAAAAPVWLKWPLRRAVDKLSYLPGEERFTTLDGVEYLNQWKGWGVKPERGDVKPFLDLIDFIFQDADKEDKEWFLDWCAYPIQFPGTKLFSAAIIHGRRTGTGKTLVGYTLAKIYGQNFIKIKSKDLYDTWWAENRQFVLGDEISGSDKRAEADMMKAMITQEEVNINIKYIPQFSIPDCVNYYLTSNHADALFLEDEDRRFFVHEIQATEPLPQSFYDKYDHWLKKGNGAAFLMEWFQRRNLKNFNPKAEARRTRARDRMIMLGKSDLDMWCAELKEAPATKLKLGQMYYPRDLFTAEELLMMYEQQHEHARGKVTSNGMSRALKRAGFKQAYKGQPLDGKDKQGRYYIVRNPDRWARINDRKVLNKHVVLPPVRD